MEYLAKDSECPYLFVRTTHSGNQSWVFYKTIGGKPRKLKISNFSEMTANEARMQALDILSSFQSSLMRAKERDTLTVKNVFDTYFDLHVSVSNSRPKEVQQAFNKHWTCFKNRPIAQLTTLEVEQWKVNLRNNIGEPTANRQLNQLRACINWAMKKKLITLDENPCEGVATFPPYERTEYLQRGAQYNKLKEVLDEKPGQVASIIWLALFTTARKSNVLMMRWQDIDFEAEVWTIPAKLNNKWNTKTRRTMRVALTTPAVELLKHLLMTRTTSEWVFPSPNNSKKPRRTIDAAWYKLRTKAGLKHLHIHDLRATLPSWMGEKNTNQFIIKDMLGHANLRMTEKYTRLALATIRANMEAALAGAHGALHIHAATVPCTSCVSNSSSNSNSS